ncbi:MAG: hypothetical protein AB7G93_10345 [Bdellovibrionales bacterium]
MAQSVIHLTQSRYYSPVFNAAVFDGPIRIYFAQHQEALALKVYLRLQQCLQEIYSELRRSFRQRGRTVFLMLYPTVDSFQISFPESDSGNVVSERLSEDHVVGVRGPLADAEYDEVFATVKSILQGFEAIPELVTP